MSQHFVLGHFEWEIYVKVNITLEEALKVQRRSNAKNTQGKQMKNT